MASLTFHQKRIRYCRHIIIISPLPLSLSPPSPPFLSPTLPIYNDINDMHMEMDRWGRTIYYNRPILYIDIYIYIIHMCTHVCTCISQFIRCMCLSQLSHPVRGRIILWPVSISLHAADFNLRVVSIYTILLRMYVIPIKYVYVILITYVYLILLRNTITYLRNKKINSMSPLGLRTIIVIEQEILFS